MSRRRGKPRPAAEVQTLFDLADLAVPADAPDAPGFAGPPAVSNDSNAKRPGCSAASGTPPEPLEPGERPAVEPLSVSELTGAIKGVLETALPAVRVAGELTNVTRARSGHLYMSLQDDAARLRVVMWRGRAESLRFDPEDGLAVVAEGRVEVYAQRGEYQLICERLTPHGVGDLELAFRQLQAKLAAEGLYDPSRKRPLPAFPRHLAVVTSPGGAAVRDVLQVLGRRWAGCRVTVVPTVVQGAGAAAKIAAALADAARLPGVDLLLLVRGGGGLEDLWAFNEEPVARAVADCGVPVLTGVGHEIDVSIADLVADRRALTPSEAAELAVPDRREIAALLAGTAERLRTALRSRAAHARTTLDHLAARPAFARPLDRVRDRQRRLDDLADALTRAACRRTHDLRCRLDALGSELHALSPLAVLGRGYSLTRREDGTLVTDAGDVSPGDTVLTRLHAGELRCRVEEIEPDVNQPRQVS